MFHLFRAVPFLKITREEKELSGLKSVVVIRKGIKVRAVHTDSARRVKVNLSQLVRGFPERSICLRRYIQEMKFLERSPGDDSVRKGTVHGDVLIANGQLLSLSRGSTSLFVSVRTLTEEIARQVTRFRVIIVTYCGSFEDRLIPINTEFS